MGSRRLATLIISFSSLAVGRGAPAGAAGIVYVVHAIDSESHSFLADHFSQTLNLGDYAPGGSVDSMMSASFRTHYLDSFGGPIVFSWFVLTQPAFRHDSSGQVTEVYDALQRFAMPMAAYGDVLGWHHHHVDWRSGRDTSAGAWAQVTTFNGSQTYSGTDRELPASELAELMIQRNFYPTVFRAGFTWENTDLSNWLDSLIPFDFSNLAPLTKRDTALWHYDWSRAPRDWSSYHPSHQDYQTPGDSKRLILRCVPGLSVSEQSFDQAFAQAASGRDVVVAAYVHNFDDVWTFCHNSVKALHYASESYPGVKYRFVNALTAARVAAGLTDTIPPQLTVRWTGKRVVCQSNEQLYASPVCAVRGTNGVYRLLFAARSVGRQKSLEWQFDLRNQRAESIAVGGCDPAGNSAVVRIDGALAGARARRTFSR